MHILIILLQYLAIRYFAKDYLSKHLSILPTVVLQYLHSAGQIVWQSSKVFAVTGVSEKTLPALFFRCSK